LRAGYGKILHKASGSLLLPDAAEELRMNRLDRSDMRVYAGRVRLFSPREMLRLMGFPDWFQFPAHYTARQCYGLIGNSINVVVVRHVMDSLFTASSLNQPPAQAAATVILGVPQP